MNVSILAALLLAVAADAGPDAGAEDGLPSSEGEADAGVPADGGADARPVPNVEPVAPAPVVSGRILARGHHFY